MTDINQNKNVLRLEEAITHLHRQRSQEGKLRLTQAQIAEEIFPDIAASSAAQYLSGLKRGKRMTGLEPRHIARICQITGVSADFLLGLSESITNKTQSDDL